MDDSADLRRLAARYRSLVLAAGLDVWRADAAGRLLTDMPGWRDHTGQEEGTVQGEGWLDAVHPSHRARVASAWSEAVRSTAPYECEYTIVGPQGVERTVIARAAPVVEDGVVQEWIGTTTDVTEQRAAKEEQRQLLDSEQAARLRSEESDERVRMIMVVSRRLAEAGTSIDATSEVLIDTAVPRFGDWACVHLVDRGEIRLAGVRHRTPERGIELETFIRRYPPAVDQPEGAGAAVRTGRPQRVVIGAEPPQAGAAPDEHAQLRWQSIVNVPLLDQGQVVGLWSIGRESGPAHTAEDVALLDDLAGRAAVAIRNAQLLDRLRELARISAAVNAATAVDHALELVTEAARRVVGAHQAVTSLTAGDDWSQAISAVSLSDRYEAWHDFDRMPDGTGIYSVVAEEQRPMRMTQAQLEAHPRWRGFGASAAEHPPMRGWLAAPLTAPDGSNVGVLQLSDRFEGDFDEQDEATLVQLAEIAASAIHRLRLYQERSAIADALQGPLSPPVRSDVPGLEVAVRYQPYGEALGVGGDFYDVFPMQDGRWGVLIGDVCGKGPEAAAVGGVARQTAWAATRSRADVSAALAIVGEAVARSGPDRFCTAVLIAVEPGETTRLEVTCGGHPRPVVVRSSGAVERVGGQGPLLGPFADASYPTEHAELGEGDAIVLFTDGVVEGGGAWYVSDAEVDEALARLGADRDPEALLDGLLRLGAERASAPGRDDVAALALRMPDRTRSLEIEPTVGSVGVVRRWLHREAARTGAAHLADDLELVGTELVTNAILHARTPIRVDLRRVGRGFRLEVVDGRPDRSLTVGGSGLVELTELDDGDPVDAQTMTGRGLVLVSAVADAWGVTAHGDAKVVWAELATGRAAERLVASPKGPAGVGVPVRLAGIPVRLLLASAANVDDVVRELTMAAGAGAVDDEVGSIGARLFALTTGVRDPIRAAALAAAGRQERLFDVTLHVSAAACEHLQRFLEVLEDLAGASAAGHLLALAPDAEVRAFRRWYAAEVFRQVTGATPRPCPFPVVRSDDTTTLVTAALAEAATGRDDPAPAAGWLTRAEQALGGRLEPAAVLAAALEAVSELGAHAGALCLLAEDGLTVELTTAIGYAPEVEDHWSSFPVSADLPASEVIRTGLPVFLRTRSEVEQRFPIFTREPTNGDGAMAVLPVGGGALVIGFPGNRSFRERARSDLAQLAALVTRALDGTG